MKCIAVIRDEFIRDSQVFTADPAIMRTDSDWEDNFNDVKCPCHNVGVFEGASEEEVRNKAAALEGVHQDVITLVKLEAVKG